MTDTFIQDTFMQNKVVLITGATNGIGLEAARQIARTGATVVIAGRDANRLAQALADVRQSAGSANVDGLLADLTEVAGMRSLADEFLARYQRLDVLLNNAGALYTEHQLTADGFERTFALNHLSYFVVTQMLLATLQSSAPARIVNVSSTAHVGGAINFDDLHGMSGYSPLKAYSQSKLANVMFTYELARRLEGTGVTANVLHPGVVRSGFGHNNKGFVGRITSGVLSMMQRVGGVDVVQGADTAVYLCCAPEVEGITGNYWYKRRQKESSPASIDQSQWTKLWEASEAMVAAV